ncbi:hypothetical protein pmac_cds_59 [Pandoravirus macleodensis]|uniref:DUF5848 domain-containing protein n=1 Tax=Pandoravirus macleodensis TaxID=2107707 RepID=A0A2U7UE84_9VIRU|nr:hypothetical protein pmac_cds_59 [Pandoravirus macleodensis]AVK76747.1 hypothetical protein pmac_cds_59 [Pandoravirus macleodensis]
MASISRAQVLAPATRGPSSHKLTFLLRTAEATGNACRQLTEGIAPLNDSQAALLTALAAGINLPVAFRGGDTTGAGVAACAEIVRVYTWFWNALRLIEAAVPETLDVFPGLVTPRSVLEAMDEGDSGALSGMTLTRYVVSAVLLRLRAAGLITDAATANPQRPYAISAYPPVDGMHYVVLWYGDTPVAHASVSVHGDRVEDVTIVAPRLLPLVRRSSRGWEMYPIDPGPAVARLLAGAVANFEPEDRVGVLDVPEAVGNYVLYGPRPTRRFAFVRMASDVLARALGNLAGPALFVTRGAESETDGDLGYESSDEMDVLS